MSVGVFHIRNIEYISIKFSRGIYIGSGHTVYGMNCLRSNTGIVCSNPTQGMDVCVFVYSVFVLSCV
jgi:hypothetical protein